MICATCPSITSAISDAASKSPLAALVINSASIRDIASFRFSIFYSAFYTIGQYQISAKASTADVAYCLKGAE